ncbi:MAG TPA: sulfite exporter TauE/SafE family protein [Roseiflexaceae bacterium]|nr:sulfite exporter TauE/SafE family protein [Roseiflexaceae bacterium]
MKRWIILAAAALAATLGVPAGTAAAHPLGNFTVNQYSRVEAGATALRVRYIVDMAEIPAFQERQAMDADGDGAVSDAEAQAYLVRRAPELAAGLRLAVDGTPATLRPLAQTIGFPPGQGGLTTLRIVLDLQAPLAPSGAPRRVEYAADSYPERLGWREIVVLAGPGASLRDSSTPAVDRTRELTAYPDDMLSSPLDVRAARFTLVPGGPAAAPAAGEIAARVPAAGRAADALAALVATRELSAGTMAAALLLALVLGAGHALTPGHGKTVVAAYLVGARGTPTHAIVLGLVTTATHTAGVFVLGLATLLLSRYVLPERIYPWLELVSGALVVALGVGLFRSRLRRTLHAEGRTLSAEQHHNHHPGHEHGHDHHYDHTHDPDHGHTYHDHDHEHDHHHGPGGHTHDHEHLMADLVAQAIHNQAPRRGEAKIQRPSVSWRGLLALGISGGLLPCPSALVVLLGAIALGRVGFGMLLIVAFSLGLAAVLTGIGLLLVYARGLFDRIPASGRLLRALPVASAAVVVVAGLGITAAAIAQL